MTAQQKYWAAMTPEERAAEMKRRQKKWSSEAKARWSGKRSPKLSSLEARRKRDREKKREQRAKKKAKLSSTAAAKQKIYAARNFAKAHGLPIPPLPAKAA